MESLIATLKFEIKMENHLNIKVEVEVKKIQEAGNPENIHSAGIGDPFENPLHDEDMDEPNNEENAEDEILNEEIEEGEVTDDMDVILADEYEDGALRDYYFEEEAFENEAGNFAMEEEIMEDEDEEPEPYNFEVEEGNPMDYGINEEEIAEGVEAGLINHNGGDPINLENAILADYYEDGLDLEEEELEEENGNFAWGEEIFYPEFEEEENQMENENSEEDNSSSITDDGEIEENPEELIQEEEEDKVETQVIDEENTDEEMM